LTVGASEFVGWQTPALASLLDLERAIAHLADERLRQFRIRCLLLKGEALEVVGKPQLARPLVAEADSLVATMPDSKLKARAMVASGMSMWTAGDREIGRAKIEAGLAMHVVFRNTNGLAESAIYAAEAMHRDGDTDEAIAISRQTLPYFLQHSGRATRGMQISNLTSYLLAAGRLDEARGYLDQVLPITIDAQQLTVLCLVQCAAEVAALDGHLAKAALLVGYVDQGLRSYSSGRQITEERQLERILSSLVTQGMDAEKLSRLRSQGAAMGAFEAQRLAGIAWR
jgi:hypothetical protein